MQYITYLTTDLYPGYIKSSYHSITTSRPAHPSTPTRTPATQETKQTERRYGEDVGQLRSQGRREGENKVGQCEPATSKFHGCILLKRDKNISTQGSVLKCSWQLHSQLPQAGHNLPTPSGGRIHRMAHLCQGMRY